MLEKTAQIKESELLDLIDKTRALDATYKLLDIVLQSFEFSELTKNVSNIIPAAMGYQLGILFMVDYPNAKLTKVGISDSIKEEAILHLLDSPKKELFIPFGYEDNLAIKAVNEKKQQESNNLYDFLRPAITWQEGRVIQNILGTNGNIATPLMARGKAIGVFVVGMAKDVNEISDFEKLMLTKFSENAGIAVENSKLYANLKLAKEDLHKAYENLQVLNKLKDEFLSVASHELRTPMTIVKSYLWMLEKQKSGKLNSKQMDYLQKALEGTQRMIALINDMLDISRFEQKKVTFDLRQINICEAVSDSITSFEVQAKEKGISIVFDNKCTDLFVDADEIKLRDIMTNLIGNAIKFTKEGEIRVGVEDGQDFVKIWVKDSGSGIDPVDLDRLFHKFARIDNSYTIASDAGGTGLGLYIVKLYIEGMGGKTGAWSEGLTKGSTFWCTLPKNKIQKFGGGSVLKQIDIPVQDIGTIQ
jgi:signal transduction histidine kinase